MPALVRCSLLFAALLLASPALAQGPARPTTPLAGEPPTMGVHLPDASLVSGSDAAAVELNPGALGLAPSWSVLLHHAELRDDGRMAGAGDALLVALPLPLLDRFRLGLGLQWLRPADAMGYSDSVKLSLALGFRVRQVFALGLSLHTFLATNDDAMDALVTADLGLVFRPLEWLGAGLVVRNLTNPDFGGFPLQREYDMELLFRPLSTRRLELGLGLRVGERRKDLDPRLRLSGEPLAGLRLFGQAELLHRDYYRDGDALSDVRFTVGLSLHLEQVGLALSTMLGRPLPAGPGPLSGSGARGVYQGVGATVTVQGERRPPLFQLDRRLVVIHVKEHDGERDLLRLTTLLRRVERRADIAGVLLSIDGASMGWADVQEVRGALRRLRKAGKTTVAYLRAPSGLEYYMAAAAQHVLLDSAGGIRMQGLAMRTLFFKGLLDKVGVSAQFVRIAEYKSAPEAYTRSTASAPVRKLREQLVGELYTQLVTDLAADRKKGAAALRKVLDQGPFTPDLALAAGLVDRLVEPGKLDAAVEQLTGADLARADVLLRRAPRWRVGPGVAVVLVEGDIVRGKSSHIPLLNRRLAGDETVVSALSWARANSAVKAVVLRINSPGGSAMASHRMWQEVMRLRESKPVVVSMGNLAASGGYYVACAGHKVYAQPGTFTGSIGIFTGKFDLSGLLTKLGVGVDTHSRGKRALMESFHRPYTAAERKFIRGRLGYFYDQFRAAVSKGRSVQGRKMSIKRVDQLGRGRVWTGKQAVAQGLADATGGLADAVAEARRRAGLAPDRSARLFVLPAVKKTLLSRMMELATSASAPRLPLPPAVNQALRAVPPVLLRARSGEPLARMPYEISLGD